MRELREFASDLAAHWNDSYWWLDHQALRLALIAVVTGIIGVMFTYLNARVDVAVRQAADA